MGQPGLIDGGLPALMKLGEERQMKHFAGVDDQFQQDHLFVALEDIQKPMALAGMVMVELELSTKHGMVAPSIGCAETVSCYSPDTCRFQEFNELNFF